MHDPWSMFHDMRCIMWASSVCHMPARETSVRVRFGFHIFVGIKQKKPVFILEYPNGLKGTTCLVKIVSGDVDAKKMGWPSWSVPWNPTTARQQERHKNYRFNKAKQPFFTCSSLFFLYISLPSPHDYEVKMPNFTFYRGRKQETTKFSFSFLTWIGIQLLGQFAYIDKRS